MSDYSDYLRRERRSELAMRTLPAEMFNEYGEVFFATKTEGGTNFPASDYAYTPDKEKPSTWKLRLTSTPGGDPDPHIVGAAMAALGKGFRGNKVDIPTVDLAGVKAKVKAAWIKANPDKDPKNAMSVEDSDTTKDVPSLYGYESEDIEELGSLPPALKAQLVKKLEGQLAKEKDPKKIAELEAKIKAYS